MRYRTGFLALFVLVLGAGCASSNDDATDETSTAPSETMAVTTTSVTTTTVPEPVSAVDEALVPAYAAKVREKWVRAESLGGTVPVLDDDEIAAIGVSICQYFSTHPLAVHAAPSAEERMEAYSDVAVIVTDALGIPYDRTLQDAGFESWFDSRMVTAFKYTLEVEHRGGLCPPPQSGEHSMPCASSTSGCAIFRSPWKGTASPESAGTTTPPVDGTQSPGHDKIQGTWHDSTTGVYLEYDANGGYKVAGDSDFADTFEWGVYTFDREKLTQDTASDSPVCPDTTATWTVAFTDVGDKADLTFIDDSCVPATRSQDQVWIRQSS